MDLSQYTDEELMVMAGRQPDISSMSDEELMQIAGVPKAPQGNPYRQANQEQGVGENLWSGLGTGAKSRVLGLAQLGMEGLQSVGLMDEDNEYYKASQDAAERYRMESEGTGAAGLAGEILGDPLTYATLPFAAGAGLGKAAVVGAGMGGAAGATSAYTQDESRLAGTGTSAALGTVLAPVASKGAQAIGRGLEKTVVNPARNAFAKAANWMAKNADDTLAIEIKGLVSYDDFANAAKSMGDDAVNAFKKASKSGLSPKQSYLAAKATSKGIQIPRGDLTQDPTLQRLQDQAKMGVLGDEAQTIASASEQTNDAALRTYGRDIMRGLTGIDDALVDDTHVANAVRQGVTSRAAALKKPADEAFKAGALTQAKVPASELLGMHKNIRDRLVQEGYDIGDMPTVSRALGTMRKAEKVLEKRVGSAKYKALEVYRKRLNKMQMGAANPAERDAIRQIKNEYTDKLDDIITNNLLENPDAAAAQLRQAPALWRDYKQAVFGKDGKAALGKIVDNDLTDKQVADLFGSSAFGKGDTQAVVKQLKGLLGPDSQEMGQVRGMFFNRILKGALDEQSEKPIGTAIRANINKFKMNNNSLYKELFDEASRKEIDDFANIAWTMSNKVKSRVNPSGSGVYASGFASGLLSRMGLSGQVAANILTGIQSGSKNATQARAATKAIMEPLKRAGADTRIISDALRNAGVVGGAMTAPQERNLLQ